MIQAPPKARSDVEILVEKFNEWADGMMVNLRFIASQQPFSDNFEIQTQAKIVELQWAKKNLKRLAEEMVSE